MQVYFADNTAFYTELKDINYTDNLHFYFITIISQTNKGCPGCQCCHILSDLCQHKGDGLLSNESPKLCSSEIKSNKKKRKIGNLWNEVKTNVKHYMWWYITQCECVGRINTVNQRKAR